MLGRVSNLPTVWSDCLAAWLVCGGGDVRRFSLVCASGTLFYSGGMFLNDACDVGFDRQHRPERPIIRGQIQARTVWIIAGLLLLGGWLATLPLGPTPMLYGAALGSAIIVYDLVHKRTKLAPVLMAGCRFLLYLVAATAVTSTPGSALIWRAAALGIYVLGLSYLARTESTAPFALGWPAMLLFAPMLITSLPLKDDQPSHWTLAIIQGAWVLWCLSNPRMLPKTSLPRGIAGLLGGIVLVDWLAAGNGGQTGWVFAALFALALVLQRVAPAT